MKTENILSIQQHSSVYLGELDKTRFHKHAAVVLLVGLSGPISIEFEGGVRVDCRSAILDAGLNHALDPCGQRVASVFFALDQQFTQWLKFAFLHNQSYAFEVIDPAVIRKSKEQQIITRDWDSVFQCQPSTIYHHPFDPRILDCVTRLNLPEHFADKQADFAQRVYLSSSRLNHLFKQTTGVSFRHYRLWSQLLHFMRSLNRSKSMLDTAHSSGFYDSAHLSNSYQKMLGISPSSLIRKLDRFEV